MKLERIDVNFEIKQILQEQDDGFFRFEGLASTFGNIDLVDDIVVKGAFTESLEKRIPKILWQHSYYEPIGMPEIIKEVDEGLFLVGKLPKEDTLVKGRVIPQIKVGSVNTMSIGFSIPEGGSEVRSDGVRLLKRIDLKEVSLVTFEANSLAKVSGFKNEESKTVTPFQGNLPVAPSSRSWDSSAAISRVRQATNSEESPSRSYRNNFLWYDSSATDNFGSYKFPFVDIINGQRTVIPRAINNAKARLSNSSIPTEDKPRVLSIIERYQEKFEKDFYDLSEVKSLTIRELENLLRDSGLFSKKAATFISSNLNLGDPDLGSNDDNFATALLEKLNQHSEDDAINNLIKKVDNYANSD